MMHPDDKIPSEAGEEQPGSVLRNVLKLLFLAAVLIAAWFVLDWLINR